MANQLTENILKLLSDNQETSGMLHEYYSPETGKAVCGDHFMSRNSLADFMGTTKQMKNR